MSLSEPTTLTQGEMLQAILEKLGAIETRLTHIETRLNGSYYCRFERPAYGGGGPVYPGGGGGAGSPHDPLGGGGGSGGPHG